MCPRVGYRHLLKRERDLPTADLLIKLMVYFREREIVIENLLVRIHLIIEMISVDRPCAMGV